jgi:hypothetical protein
MTPNPGDEDVMMISGAGSENPCCVTFCADNLANRS